MRGVPDNTFGEAFGNSVAPTVDSVRAKNPSKSERECAIHLAVMGRISAENVLGAPGRGAGRALVATKRRSPIGLDAICFLSAHDAVKCPEFSAFPSDDLAQLAPMLRHFPREEA